MRRLIRSGGASDVYRERSKDIRDHRRIDGSASRVGLRFPGAHIPEALALEFAQREIPFVRELKLSLAYKGQPLKSKYSPDFICYASVVVELKALNRVGNIEEAQVINYLKATGHEVGLLINFGQKA